MATNGISTDQWRATIGSPVEARRKRLGWSIREAARQAGVSDVTWRQVESGRRQIAPGQFIPPNPNERTTARICRALRWPDSAFGDLWIGHDVGTEELARLQQRLGVAFAAAAERRQDLADSEYINEQGESVIDHDLHVLLEDAEQNVYHYRRKIERLAENLTLASDDLEREQTDRQTRDAQYNLIRKIEQLADEDRATIEAIVDRLLQKEG